MGGPGGKSTEQAHKDALLRKKKFESAAKKNPPDLQTLAKMQKLESDPKLKAEMANSIKKLTATYKKSVAATPAASGPGPSKLPDPKEADKRLKKFMLEAKKNPPDLRLLEKLEKSEIDAKVRSEMSRTVKKFKAEEKKIGAVAPGKLPAVAVSDGPASGPSKLPDPNAAQKRLKDFVAKARKGNVDLKKLEKDMRMEPNPQVKAQMEKELSLAKKTQAKK